MIYHLFLNEAHRDNSSKLEVKDIVEIISPILNTSKNSSVPMCTGDTNIVVHNLQNSHSSPDRVKGEIPLLSIGKPANFIFKVSNFNPNPNDISLINILDSVRDRIDSIKKFGGLFQFSGIENSILYNNMVLIDSLLPNIMAEVLLTFYTCDSDSIEVLTNRLEELNPMDFDLQFSQPYYKIKVTNFLKSLLFEKSPINVWQGKQNIKNGYIVSNLNGNTLLVDCTNELLFEEYLFKNTKLDTASSTRNDFGTIYEENGAYYFKLNLQIRFLS